MATYESVAKEFPDLPKKRIEKIVEWRNSAPQREAESARKLAEDKARSESNARARVVANREKAIKQTEGSKDELAKLRAQQYRVLGSDTLTPEQEQHNKDIVRQMNVEMKRRREAANKALIESYDKRKASLEAKYPNMKQFGISESIAALPTGRLDARGIEGHIRDAALVQKFQQEDKAKRVKELAAQRPSREERAASKQAFKEMGIKAKENLARTEASYARRAAEGKPVGTWTPATTATTATPATPRPAVGSNGMNAMASTITSSAPQSAVYEGFGFKKGGKVAAKKYAKGGKVSSAPKTAKASTASRRGDGIAQRGKTRGRML